MVTEPPDARTVGVEMGGQVERIAAVAQKPERAMLDQTPAVEQHSGLHRPRHAIVECLDRMPDVTQPARRARDRYGERAIAGPTPRTVLHPPTHTHTAPPPPR